MLKLHIVPPEPVRRGLWSSPLLTVGPKLYTLFDGPASLTGEGLLLQLPRGEG